MDGWREGLLKRRWGEGLLGRGRSGLENQWGDEDSVCVSLHWNAGGIQRRLILSSFLISYSLKPR